MFNFRAGISSSGRNTLFDANNMMSGNAGGTNLTGGLAREFAIIIMTWKGFMLK
jgi:hypothetical protein